MYIEYVRNQLETHEYEYTPRLLSSPIVSYRTRKSIVSEYKPSWLVRVSDMQVVPGSSVHKHYWALSYSWNQSGTLIHKGGENYDRIDEGRHQITEYQKVPGHKMEDTWGHNTITGTDFNPETASTKFVTFQDLIQQVCKDFDIEYIWYDQMCINQDDHDAKMREIKQMHLVYKNAIYTMALIPDFQWTLENGRLGAANMDVIPRTQWCKRIWTLEEAYVSERILFLGRNVHYWADAAFIWAASTDTPYLRISKPESGWMACTVLWYARNRTSSKAHDRVFALANIFPELMDSITFSYELSLHDLMFQLYRALAQKDSSILWFGAPLDSGPEDETTTVRQREANYLPSWTGSNGAYVTQFALNEAAITTPNYSITGKLIRLTSSFVIARIESTDAVEKPDDFDVPDSYRTVRHSRTNLTYKQYVGEDKSPHVLTEDGVPVTPLPFTWEGCVAGNESADLTFIDPSKSYRLFNPERFYGLGLKATHILPITLEDKPQIAINTLSKPTHYGGFLSLTEECSKCTILFEPAFHGNWVYDAYPVIKEDKDCYRSIGVFVFDRSLTIDSFFQSKQTFNIK